MSERIFVRPAEGLSVPDPEEGLQARYPAEGKYTADSLYVRRRLLDGSLVLVDLEQESMALVAASAPAPVAERAVASSPYSRRRFQPPADPADQEPLAVTPPSADAE